MKIINCKLKIKNSQKVLPKINRLTKKKDFDVVFKKGESIKNDFLIFKVLKNHLKENRFGFIVSKKISNKANQRNKIKRRLRAAVLGELKNVRQLRGGKVSSAAGTSVLVDKKSIDVIIIALPGIKKKEFPEIQEVINKSFRKIGII